MKPTLKERVYDVLVETDDGDLVDRIVAVFLMVLIIVNAFAVVVESDAEIALRFAPLFNALEIFSVTIFTIEYGLRVWIAPLDPRFPGAIRGRGRYICTPLALIDLVALLPFYAPMLVPLDLRVVRILRVFRLFRLLKLARYAESLNMFSRVLRDKKEELLVSLFLLGVLLVCASTLLHVVEGEAQPDKFGSIPQAMWWSAVTLTTVGYGDVFPVTAFGKMCGAIIAIIGIGMFALPTSILATGFTEELQRRRAARLAYLNSTPAPERLCPHCGKSVNDIR